MILDGNNPFDAGSQKNVLMGAGVARFMRDFIMIVLVISVSISNKGAAVGTDFILILIDKLPNYFSIQMI